METPKPKEQNTKSLRLRIFAGPNGSGKSTIINAVRNTIVNDHPVDFGYYINAVITNRFRYFMMQPKLHIKRIFLTTPWTASLIG